MATQRILVIDDEESLCEILKFNFETEGYEVTSATSAEEALQLPLEEFDLLLLDVMMGPMSGFELARRLKNQAATSSIPIIFCSARDTEDDTVRGLNLGADDYIAKPFSMREMLARVKSVLRRSERNSEHSSSPSEAIRFEGLEIHRKQKCCTIDGVSIPLTKKEFEILALLLAHRGTIFSREEILRRVWPDEVIVLDRTVDVNITRLRKKIGVYGTYITTRLGYGYGFLA